MTVRVLVSLVLAFTPGAQAAVVSGRLPVGLVRAPVRAAVAPALSLTPSSPLAVSLAPSLSPSLAVSLPALSAPALAPAAAAALAAPEPAFLRAAPAAAPQTTPAIDLRFKELRAAFDEKTPPDAPEVRAEDSASGLSPTAAPAEGPAAPQPPTPPKPPRRAWTAGFARPLVFFLIALAVSQMGIEAQSAALPPLIAQVFGNVSVAADVGMVASVADLVGTILTPVAVQRLGLKRAYLGSTGLRVVMGGLLAGLLAAGWLSVPGLMVMTAVDSLLLGMSWTTEKSIPAVVMKQDQSKLERFKAARQTVIETVATVIPIATGAAVAAWGFLPALFAFPLALTCSVALIAITLKLPAQLANANIAVLPGPQPGPPGSFLKSLGRRATS